MLNLYDLGETHNNKVFDSLIDDARAQGEHHVKALTDETRSILRAGELTARSALLQIQNKIKSDYTGLFDCVDRLGAAMRNIATVKDQNSLREGLQSYLTDAGQRLVLALDVLRERGDIFLEHEGAGCPPVLAYQYEVVIDGANLARPSNYMLLSIVPPDGVEVDPTRRPYIIIDPRAGHGSGIAASRPTARSAWHCMPSIRSISLAFVATRSRGRH
jgi:hypothetical protein